MLAVKHFSKPLTNTSFVIGILDTEVSGVESPANRAVVKQSQLWLFKIQASANNNTI